jgi:hypothetical protein
VTPSGIDPATFRFVAQCIDHCATATQGIKEREKLSCDKVVDKETVLDKETIFTGAG